MQTPLPPLFLQRLTQMMGSSAADSLAQSLDEAPTTTLRLHPQRVPEGGWEGLREAVRVPWCEEGYELTERPAFTFDPLMHAGAYYVQDASSMFVTHVLRQVVQQPVLLLDLCAAPGGKSTALRAALPEGSVVVANEALPQRASILAENICRWGHPDLMATHGSAAAWGQCTALFDVLVADVPCSGEGMMRKDEVARQEWSIQNVEHCASLQRSIVADAWPSLRPGGWMIYSTCTFNTEENEENVDWICRHLGADAVAVHSPEAWGVAAALWGNRPVSRFFPGKVRGEGLCMALLRKHGDAPSLMANGVENCGSPSRRKQRKERTKAPHPTTPSTQTSAESLLTLLQGQWTVRTSGQEWWGVPTRWAWLFDRVAQLPLHILHAGASLGQLRGGKVQPDARLSLSLALQPEALPRVELSYTEALAYLRREAVPLPSATPRGWVVVTFEGLPIGMEKHLGTRANNLHPTEWRIRSTHLPQQPVQVLCREKRMLSHEE